MMLRENLSMTNDMILLNKLIEEIRHVIFENNEYIKMFYHGQYNNYIDEVNEIIRKYALEGNLVEQIQYAFSNELVSTDVIGNPCPSVFDSQATIISPDKKSIILYIWYDNEYGYTRQVIRFSKFISEVRRPIYY
jgi:glyceraldehyde 3-phosphate dehydrogenase